MLAARLEEGTLRIGDVPTPEPGDGEALVKISAAGVCHSDLHLARGDWLGVPGTMFWILFTTNAMNFIDGLNGLAAGVAAIAAAVLAGIAASVGFWFVYFASLLLVAGLLGFQEAPLACGGLTAYGAVKKLVKHGVVPGRPIAVVGAAGGLEHYAVQIATAFGYEVVGVDVGAERLDFVKSLGAARALDASEALEVVRSEVGGVDASLVFSAKMAGFQLAFELLGRRAVALTERKELL